MELVVPADAAAIRRAAEILRAGGLVAFPTETVYGLGANALDERAVARIYEAKGRPHTSPLIVHVSSLVMAVDLSGDWVEAAGILAQRFWPGPLTLVVPKSKAVPDLLTAGMDSVGLRWPAHPVAQALIEAAGVPVAAPSANRFTELSPTTAGHVARSLGPAVDLILDGGPAQVGIESTVLRLGPEGATLLRPGMISRADLERWIGPVGVLEGLAKSIAGPHPSPGLHERHYSPATPLYLVDRVEELPKAGRGVFLSWGPSGAQACGAFEVRMPEGAQGYAEALYETLHRMDAGGWDWIGVQRPGGGGEWAGVRDRLERAALSI